MKQQSSIDFTSLTNTLSNFTQPCNAQGVRPALLANDLLGLPGLRIDRENRHRKPWVLPKRSGTHPDIVDFFPTKKNPVS